MSELKKKSDSNMMSAQYLIDRGNFAPSIHCSYYSCVQLMLHILRSEYNKTEDDVVSESQQGSQDEGGFHNWLINFINRQFYLKNNVESREFYSKITQLKGVRVVSDYKNKEIKFQKAKDTKEYAKEVLELLNKNFII